MGTKFDAEGINHAVTAVFNEMSPARAVQRSEAETLFFGGLQLSDFDRQALGQLSNNKNYNIVYLSFDNDVAKGPTAIELAVTDGETETYSVQGGRLWKRDARSVAVLVFSSLNVMVKLTSRGRILVRETKSDYHELGFELAAAAVRKRTACQPAKAPIISTIGAATVVLDLRMMVGTFALAA